MNVFAEKLELEDTSFGNVTGLPKKRPMQPKDMVIYQKLLWALRNLQGSGTSLIRSTTLCKEIRIFYCEKSGFVDGDKNWILESATVWCHQTIMV